MKEFSQHYNTETHHMEHAMERTKEERDATAESLLFLAEKRDMNTKDHACVDGSK